ncbi:unnamed protein product [Angiostrongylus costaricensis]|uniref:Uncharacterized protein n=1 Tax=Angiostrongylus costaricensis TaxID=334426 RepID=A0A0R3PE64_ANGCS|nr:unnamed protein product [Angiostrongylus costaricensis]
MDVMFSAVMRQIYNVLIEQVGTEPYELARCEPSIISELSLPASFAVAPLARSSEEINASSERNKTSWCTAQLIAPGSNGQLHSFADDQSFCPPLCSTKIGEGVRSKSLSLTAVELTNGPPKEVGGDLTTGKIPPTTNFLTSAKKIAIIDIANFSEKPKKRDSEEIDIDGELLRKTTDVANWMCVEMSGVNPPANDLDFANAPNFCSNFGNKHRLLDGTTEILNDDEVSEVLAPPNTPVDVGHRKEAQDIDESELY